jgi:hypothetical protein
LTTTFAFSGISGLRQHYGRYTNDRDLADLTSIYQKAGLRHRITLDGNSGIQPAVKVIRDEVSVDWTTYDNQIGPFLDGFAMSRGEPLSGARMTSVALRTPPSLKTARHQIQFWKQASAHFPQERMV